MKGIVFLVFAVLLTLCVGGCCRPEDIGTQTVPLRGQETPVWCWAASAEMVHKYYGNNDITQDKLAADITNVSKDVRKQKIFKQIVKGDDNIVVGQTKNGNVTINRK